MRRQATLSHLLYPGLIAMAFALFFISDTEINALRGHTLSAVSPVLKFFRVANRASEIIPASIVVPVKPDAKPDPAAANRETELNAKIADLNTAIEQITHENVRLQSELNRATSAGAAPHQPSITADVVGRKALWQEPILALSRGETDGIRVNAGVLHRGAVLGRIISVGANASCMALLTNRGMSVAARLVDCRVEGVLSGSKEESDERFCRMSVVGREVNTKAGEQVVTSGFDGTFPAGLWLGTVMSVRKMGDVQWELTVRPACTENSVESVHVLTGAPPEVPWPAIPVKARKVGEKR